MGYLRALPLSFPALFRLPCLVCIYKLYYCYCHLREFAVSVCGVSGSTWIPLVVVSPRYQAATMYLPKISIVCLRPRGLADGGPLRV